MTGDGYRNGAALWSAVASHARTVSRAAGLDTSAVIRRFVFGRFLARVFHDPGSPWVLKGGIAVLARVNSARTTKDIDLLRQVDSLDAAVTALRDVAAVDLGDHFRFVVRKVETSLGGTGQPGVDGCRISVDAYVGAVKKGVFGVDLVTGSLMTAAPDLVVDHVLELQGLIMPAMRLYPVVDHVADKLCAVQAGYGADGLQPSSRVRDLVDLVVFARTQDVDGSSLTSAVHGEWAHRRLLGSPRFDPPEAWDRLYPPIARKVPVCSDLVVFGDAVALVRTFLSPALDGTATGSRWRADDVQWGPSDATTAPPSPAAP